MVVHINIKDEEYKQLKELADRQCRTVPSLLRQGYKLILNGGVEDGRKESNDIQGFKERT